MTDKPRYPRGGGFLVEPVLSQEIFTREDIPEDQLLYEKTAEDFMKKEVVPKAEDIDAKKEGLMVSLLKKAGELGLLMVDVPEEYGGLGLNKATVAPVVEKLGLNAAFNATYGAHTGIGTLPIVYYGNEEQKKKYLPLLATGEKLSCYALTEPYAGSDALSIKTTAKLSPDKKFYILNGTKQFITNAGFADIIVTYAKIDGDKFTSFILERDYPGISIGPEEHKMGITGSSTCQVILEDVKVPVENLLGEIGKGHYIAFNILNMGRFKLGVGTSGGAKDALNEAVKYGLERKQFNTPIVQFPAIKQKIADVAVAIFVLDSITYRVAGAMDQGISLISSTGADHAKETIKVVEEYALEDSIVKVFGSETMSLAVDHGVQIHGGYGYIKEYPIERAYRDARINRLFEGTNEINRLIIPATIMRKAMRGQLPVMDVMGAVKDGLTDKGKRPAPGKGPLAVEAYTTEMAKRACLYSTNEAIQKYGQGLDKEQEALMAIADMVIDLLGMDSVVGRADKIVGKKGEEAGKIAIEIARVFCAEATERVTLLSRRLLTHLFRGDELATHLKNLGVYIQSPDTDIYASKRVIADRVIADGGWNLTTF